MSQSVVLVNPVYGPTQAELEANYQVHKLWESSDKTKLLSEIADEVRGIVTDGGSGASAELMRQLPKVEVVTVFGVGVDAVDLDYCKATGIRVGNTPDVLSDDVADLALALCLASYRQIPSGHNYAANGQWESDGPMHLTAKFSGSSVGIFGLGRIGQSIAKRLEGFDCDISYCNRRERNDVEYKYFSDLREMAQSVDCLVVAVAPTPDMAGTIGADVLGALGPAGHIINISRGLVINESALIKALSENQIAGAGLDVFANEPSIPEALRQLPNVVLQPHVASGTVQTRTAMGKLMLENLANYFDGKELTAFVA